MTIMILSYDKVTITNLGSV